MKLRRACLQPKDSLATETLVPNISARPTHSCHWVELHRVCWLEGLVHSCYVVVSHTLYQILPNKGKLTLCLDSVFGKTYFQLIATTVTLQASTPGSLLQLYKMKECFCSALPGLLHFCQEVASMVCLSRSLWPKY